MNQTQQHCSVARNGAPTRNISGFTLVELMISMVLGLLVIAGVVSVLLANKQSYKTNTALSQLQDNARTAFEMMARDIRQAGSSPCGNTTVSSNLASLNGANTDWYLWGTSVFGMDNATTASPALPGAVAQSAIATHGAGPVSTTLITAGAACANGAPFAAAPAGISAGDLVLACDTNQAYIYQTAAFAGGMLPVAAVGVGQPGNAAATLGCGSFGQSAYVAPYEADVWYVRPAGAGAPANTLSLYRARYAAGGLQSNEIIRGVRQLLVTYHLSGSTNFVTATAVGAAAWASVDAVRVSLTLQSTDNRAGTGTNAANPTSLLRTFTTTIGIR